MKRISSLFILALSPWFITGAASAAPVTSATQVISGTIQGGSGSYVFITYEYNQTVHKDSALVVNDTFQLSTAAPEPMKASLQVSGSNQLAYFFLSGDTIRITAGKQRLYAATFTGSPEQAAWDSYRKEYLDKVPPRKEARDTAFGNALDRIAEKFITDYKHRSVAAMILYDRFITYMNIPVATRLFNQLTPQVQQSYYGKRVAYMLSADNRTAIGNTAPDFELPDSLGNRHSIREFRGKYVLIDFWASWCVPCRKENPGLVKAYQQYHAKGFDIVSISLDSNQPQWLASAQKDGLLWQQWCDLKAYDGPVTALYGVHAIPQNFLLDKQGKIIARNLRGEKVQTMLAALFEGK